MPTPSRAPTGPVVLRCERLEARETPAVTITFAGGTLGVTDTTGGNRIRVVEDGADLLVPDGTTVVAQFASANVSAVTISDTGAGDVVVVTDGVPQPVNINGGDGTNKLVAGGGAAVLSGGPGNDSLFGGLNGGPRSTAGAVRTTCTRFSRRTS